MWQFFYAVAQQAADGLSNSPVAPAQTPASPGGGTAAAPACGPEQMAGLLPFVLIFVVMWFMLLWPKQRQEKERRRMLDAIKKGDMVVTMGGMCGTVESLTDKHVVLRVDKNVTIQFLRSAVASVVTGEIAKQ